MSPVVEQGPLQRPELAPRERPGQRESKYLLISVDDHLVEPATIFENRVPKRFVERAPRVVLGDDRIEYWVIGEERLPKTSGDAGQTWLSHFLGPVNYGELMVGTWDPDERIGDMDVAGVAATVTFPSQVFGFAGRRLSELKDIELGRALVGAYNDWLIEEWAVNYPDRLIPSQLPYLVDGREAAGEVERNAERGFRAVTFSESPACHGFPSIYSDNWDPFFRACEETETVVNLHVGSSSHTVLPSPDSTYEVRSLLFPMNSYATAADWLYAGIPTRYPEIKIVLSEGGLGWVPMLLDRLDFAAVRVANSALFTSWKDTSSPADVLRRNFWFAVLHDPAALTHRDRIGVDHILFETDYPHLDSTWPDCQTVVDEQLRTFSAVEVEKVTHANAARIYRIDTGKLRASVPFL